MADGIYVALSGAIAQSLNLDSTSQNLANASTDGYQRMRPVFREELSRAGSLDPALHYSSVGTTQLDTTRGELRDTGRALDFAMPQGTYLAVSTSNGERYTRAASLGRGHGLARAARDRACGDIERQRGQFDDRSRHRLADVRSVSTRDRHLPGRRP
jgi:flagellar basal body rod protein FlgF